MNKTKELIFDELKELSKNYPQQRIGQLISNYIIEPYKGDIFYLEDKILLDILKNENEKAKEYERRVAMENLLKSQEGRNWLKRMLEENCPPDVFEKLKM